MKMAGTRLRPKKGECHRVSGAGFFILAKTTLLAISSSIHALAPLSFSRIS